VAASRSSSVGRERQGGRDFVQRYSARIDRKVASMQCHAEPATARSGGGRIRLTNEAIRLGVEGGPERSVAERGGRCGLARTCPTGRIELLQEWSKRAGGETSRAAAHAVGRPICIIPCARGDPMASGPGGKLFDPRT